MALQDVVAAYTEQVKFPRAAELALLQIGRVIGRVPVRQLNALNIQDWISDRQAEGLQAPSILRALAITIRRIEGGILGNGTEMTPDMTLFEAGLALCIDMDKRDFAGRNALLGKDTVSCLLSLTCGSETPLASSVVLVATKGAGQITAGIASSTLWIGIG